VHNALGYLCTSPRFPNLVARGNYWDREPGEKEDGDLGTEDGFRALVVERHVFVAMRTTRRHEDTRVKNLPLQDRGTCHERHGQK